MLLVMVRPKPEQVNAAALLASPTLFKALEKPARERENRDRTPG